MYFFRFGQWVISVGIAFACILLLSALAGPFGFALMLVGGALLSCAALVVGGLAVFLLRGRSLRLVFIVFLFVVCWAVALVLAAGMALLFARLPTGMQSDVTPFLTWLALLGPFAVVGAVASSVSLTIVGRGRSKPGV